MGTLITISSANINYSAGTTDCQCSVTVDVPTVGETFVARGVSLASGSLPPDWTDADLCAAVAEALEVPVSDVSVATGFADAIKAKADASGDLQDTVVVAPV